MIASGISLGARMASSFVQSEQGQSLVRRAFTAWRLRTTRVRVILMEDCTRKDLNLDLDEKQYEILNLERAILAGKSEEEIKMHINSKLESCDMYFQGIKHELRAYLTKYRKIHSGKTILVLASNIAIMRALHVEDMDVYQLTEDAFNRAIEGMPDASKSYYIRQRKILAPFAIQQYASLDELKRAIEFKFK